ncbi:unnamed protein product [Medioppia subpectinata]|uniref:Uncharacterized protein n=1 Tax=Medioppia subpectinata TaxID=1979941 RepID=A0A7R9LXT5_9ACAR|nr:unnamed protein product [Medioppia subpectinata]CAG2122591.1 unnamed protein product [Medioppia subpectinata]
MPSNTCRSVVVEMTALSDHNLLLIGKTLRETMVTITKALAANRQPPMAYAMLDAIDGPKAISVVPVTHIRSQFFRYKYGDKVSSLANFRHDQTSEVMADVCDSIERTIKHIKESVINISRNNVLHLELTYVCGRHRDQVLQDFTALLAEKRIDLSFLSFLISYALNPMLRP